MLLFWVKPWLISPFCGVKPNSWDPRPYYSRHSLPLCLLARPKAYHLTFLTLASSALKWIPNSACLLNKVCQSGSIHKSRHHSSISKGVLNTAPEANRWEKGWEVKQDRKATQTFVTVASRSHSQDWRNIVVGYRIQAHLARPRWASLAGVGPAPEQGSRVQRGDAAAIKMRESKGGRDTLTSPLPLSLFLHQCFFFFINFAGNQLAMKPGNYGLLWYWAEPGEGREQI